MNALRQLLALGNVKRDIHVVSVIRNLPVPMAALAPKQIPSPMIQMDMKQEKLTQFHGLT
ncbi:MAG: hypothetical protein HQL22_08900 [Candidatus Omnitrophica bacterium]|nr:hypothetical protein [Candidatus Omnitrophota bacterium]